MSGFIKKNKNEKLNSNKNCYFMNPSLDLGLANNLISGTSICLLEKNNFNFSNIFIRYFISSGFYQNEKTLVISSNTNHLKRIIPQLMENKKTKELIKDKSIKCLNSNDNKSKIAWRYDNQKTDINKESIFNNLYEKEFKMTDISKSIKIEELKEKIFFKEIDDFNSYEEIMEYIQNFYENNLSSPEDKSNFRVIIKDLEYTNLKKDKDFYIFLHNLQIFNRHTNSYILYNLNPDLYKNENYFEFFDFIYEIIGFKDNWDFIDFKGFIKILKINCINKFQQLKRSNLSLGIKMNKSELWLEELYETQRELLDFNKNNNKKENLVKNW